jgi:hypothetical protein
MKKNKEPLVASKEISLRVNADKTQYMVMFHEENARKNHNTETGNKSFEMVEQFQCLGTALTNQNCIHEKIKSRLRSGNACYHLVQSVLSSSLLSKNIKIKLQRNIIFPVVLYGCETWSLTLREECRLMVFKNRVLRELFGYEVDRVPGE